MNSSHVQEYFDDFYSNELDYSTKESVQQHLEECNECASEYSAFIILKEKVKSLKKEIAPPKQILEIVEKQIMVNKDIKITPLSNNILTIDFQEERKEVSSSKQSSFVARNWYWFASAAVILLIISVAVMSYSSKNVFSVEEMSNWKLISLKGGAFINGVKSDKVNVGDWIQTDSVSSVVLKIVNVGDVSIEPNSKVRFIQSDGNVSKIEVLYGTVNTSTSQADKFVLQASNMKVQDKGGSYSFKVDEKGNGVIYVNNGIANVESGNKSAVVTDGTFCLYKPEHGIGTPFRKDSKPEFQNALFQYDFNNGGMPSVYYAMANALPQDYSSLLNLIPRVDEQTKYLVLNKLGKLVPQGLPTISMDSLDEFDDENVENSLKYFDKKMKVHVKIDREELARDMEELARDLAQMKIDHKQMAEDMRRGMIEMKKELADTTMYYFEEWDAKDKEQFNKEMQKMKIELNENLSKMNAEFMKNAEEWKKYGKEWEKNSKEWENYGKEWEKWGKEWEKNFKPENFNFNFNFDSLHMDPETLKQLEKLEGMDDLEALEVLKGLKGFEGLKDLEKLKDLEGLEKMKIDTTGGQHKFYFKYDKDKHKNNKRDKDDEPDTDEKDNSEEI